MRYLKIIQTYFIVDGNIVLEVLSSAKKNIEFIPLISHHSRPKTLI